MTCAIPSWGSGWGDGGWGGDVELPDLLLIGAAAIRENVVRLTFSDAVYFSRILDPNDGSSTARYRVDVVAGTVGLDEFPVRPVRVVAVALGDLPNEVDLTVDRPFSPWPCKYQVLVNDLVSAVGEPLSVCPMSRTFVAHQWLILPPQQDTAVLSRDIANPSTELATLDNPLPQAGDEAILGTVPLDQSGDYAFDEGITNLKKRILRRLIVAKGRFAHLPNYGIGLPGDLKQLMRPAVRAELESSATTQISQEPDIEKVRVQMLVNPNRPNLARFFVLVRTTKGLAFRFDVPIADL